MKTKSVEVNGKVWNKDNLKELLLKNDKAVARAVAVIYSYQTLGEQETEQTCSLNGVGFNQFDTAILSSFAKQLEKGIPLSIKQTAIARKKIIKYIGQILNHMEHTKKR